MSAQATTIGWAAAFAGTGLLFVALRGQGPIASITAALAGNTAPATPLDTGSGSSSSATGPTGAPAGSGPLLPGASSASNGDAIKTALTVGSSGGPVDQAQTVVVKTGRSLTYPSGSMRLTAAAAAAWTAWTAAFGAQIPASGWRSVSAQTAANKADPKRFASAEGSFHTAGKAVDVDLGGMSAATQTKLRQTARAAGWVQARYAAGEAGCGHTNDEPWHFSFGGCG